MALIFGFLLGTVCPQDRLPWGIETDEQTGAQSAPAVVIENGTVPVQPQNVGSKADESTVKTAVQDEEVLNPKENFPLLSAACSVVRALQERDYAALAGYIHKERGLTITPYSTVSEQDLTFKPSQVKNFSENGEKYVWGMVPGANELIRMTAEEFISGYICDVDYTQAPKISIDKINITGNALENVTEAYPDCRFVEFTFPGLDASYEGLDWCSLKVVFAPSNSRWLLVGLIHSQWTV